MNIRYQQGVNNKRDITFVAASPAVLAPSHAAYINRVLTTGFCKVTQLCRNNTIILQEMDKHHILSKNFYSIRKIILSISSCLDET
jgi:hypothetical protein